MSNNRLNKKYPPPNRMSLKLSFKYVAENKRNERESNPQTQVITEDKRTAI